jgi:hypothetical protein
LLFQSAVILGTLFISHVQLGMVDGRCGKAGFVVVGCRMSPGNVGVPCIVLGVARVLGLYLNFCLSMHDSSRHKVFIIFSKKEKN